MLKTRDAGKLLPSRPMRSSRRPRLGTLSGRLAPALLAGIWVLTGAFWAEAQVYKYTKEDGSVVYTDKLSDLPAKRRARYNEKEAKAKAKAERALKRMTEQERRAHELENQRQQLMDREMADAERQKQLAALNQALESIKRTRLRLEQQRAFWREKLETGQQNLAKALDNYRRAQKEYQSLAIKASFALFPGQQARRIELERALPKLEAEVDRANAYLTETLPKKARKAGVPPGWLR